MTNVVVFQSIEEAMDRLAEFTGHVIVSGGGEIYRETLPMASYAPLYRRSTSSQRGCFLPSIPNTFEVVFEQHFTSNINYCYQIWKRLTKLCNRSAKLRSLRALRLFRD